MKTKLTLVCIVLVLFASNNVCAFPLTGDNGLANATVFGVITKDNDYSGSNNEKEVSILVDVACDMPLYNAVLVDDDDNFYQVDDLQTGTVLGEPKQGGSSVAYGRPQRNVISFSVPEGTIIKRLRIEPQRDGSSSTSEKLPQGYFTPISIDWTGVPETMDNYTAIKFYDSTHYGDNDVRFSKCTVWQNTLKITNSNSKPLQFRYGDVIFEDQYGWYYPGILREYGQDEEVTLLPGESMKTVVSVKGVSPLSRLVKLMYQNLSMDISAWT